MPMKPMDGGDVILCGYDLFVAVAEVNKLTCQFIRLVRHCLEHKTLWPAALPLFQQRLYAYL